MLRARRGCCSSAATARRRSDGAPPASTQIGAAFARSNKAEVDAAFTDLIVGDGLPMILTKSPRLRRFVELVHRSSAAWAPPAYDTLRTTLLDRAKDRVEASLELWDVRSRETGLTITSDGWSNAINEPLLNILGVNPKGSKFIQAINTSGESVRARVCARRAAAAALRPRAPAALRPLRCASRCAQRPRPPPPRPQKTAEYISEQLIKAIEAVGPDNVIQVVTDNASNCKAAGRLVEERFPHITWSPCVAHVCDLMLEDIMRIHFFADVHSESKQAVIFIR